MSGVGGWVRKLTGRGHSLKSSVNASPLPLGQAERVALRERLQPIMQTQRSLRCSGILLDVADGLGQHAGEWRGCTNDGTGCLCECHDVLAAPPVVGR